MSPRGNWDSPNPSLASDCTPPTRTGGGHTRLRVRGWGSPNPIPTTGEKAKHSVYSVPGKDYSGTNLAQKLTISLNKVGIKLTQNLAQSWQKIDTKLEAKMLHKALHFSSEVAFLTWASLSYLSEHVHITWVRLHVLLERGWKHYLSEASFLTWERL